MSVKISSLYAEISADVSKFEQGAGKVKHELKEQERALQAWSKQAALEAKSFASVERQKQQALAKTAREAEKAARDAARAQDQAHQQLVRSGQVALVAFAAISAAAISAYNSWQKYAAGVRDVAIATGTTAQESSVLLQVMGDFGIQGEDVIATAKAMREKGMVPTLETMAKLSDQFRAIEDPVKRNQFAYDNLGKSADKYFNFLSKGSSALLRNAEAVNKNLILTDAQIRQAERARLAMDAWGDAVEGAKVQTGAFFGEMVIAQDEHTKALELMKERGQSTYHAVTANAKNYAEALRDVRVMQATGGMDVQAFRLTQMAELYKRNAEYVKNGLLPSLEELSKTNANIIQDSIALTENQRNFKEQQEATTQKISEYEAKLAELFPWETEKRAEILGQIAEQKQKYDEDAAAFEQASKKKLAMMTIEKIAMQDGVAGFSNAEQERANAVLSTLSVVESAAAREAVAFDAVTTALANGELKAKDMDRALRMMEKGYTIDVVIRALSTLAQQGGSGAAQAEAQRQSNPGGNRTGYAAGGIARGPESGHWELLHGTEGVFTPEQMKYLGMGSAGKQGGGVTVQFFLDSATPDPERVAYNIAPAVTRVLRNLGMQI